MIVLHGVFFFRHGELCHHTHLLISMTSTVSKMRSWNKALFFEIFANYTVLLQLMPS